MPRTQRKLATGESAGEVVDTLLLKYADRCRQHGFVFGGKGTCIEFDFPNTPELRTDDLLVLDNGKLAEVVADVEPVIELREKDFAKLARLVWRLGNHHVPVQILRSRIRVQHLPELEALLAESGVTGVPIMAPFEPEDAEGHGDHGHEHHQHHGPGHEHHHDHHGHDHHDHDHHRDK